MIQINLAENIYNYYKNASPDNWPLYLAQGFCESGLNPHAVSPAGAVGIAQFMPDTWEWIIQKGWVPPMTKATDAFYAVPAQVHYMEWLKSVVGKGSANCLAAYNWGQGNVGKMIDGHPTTWRNNLPRETQDYILKVLNLRNFLIQGV